MATYTDDFQRSDQVLDSSANWTQPSWANTSPRIVSGDVFNTEEGSNCLVMWTGDGTWGREQSAEGALIVGLHVGVALYVSDANGCYTVTARGNGACEFSKWSNTGSRTLLHTFGSAVTGGFVTGDVLKAKADDDGSGNTLITFYKNGTEFGTRTDSTSPITSGNPGLYLSTFADTEGLSTWTGEDFQAAAVATVTATVTDQTGTALANETGVSWHWTDSFSGTPTDSGSSETTDGSGEIVVDVPNTGLSSGQFGYLTVKLSNGNVGIAREALD